MAGGLDHAVRTGADDVAEGGEKLQENRGRVRLGVRRDGADDQPGEALECGPVQCGPGGRLARRRGGAHRRGLLLPLVVRLAAEQPGPSALYVLESRQEGRANPMLMLFAML